MSDVDAREFDAVCGQCSQATRNLIDFLKMVAENAGTEVEPPTFELRGVGITYWRRGKRFCRFDPKRQADHVWAFGPGGDRVALAGAGKVSDREDGPWITIRDMRGAVRLVGEILRAYDTAVPGRRRR